MSSYAQSIFIYLEEINNFQNQAKSIPKQTKRQTEVTTLNIYTLYILYPLLSTAAFGVS